MRILILVGVVAAALAAPASASARCLASSERQKFERAEVVFVAIAMPGPNARRGQLLSPARFRVVRYLKGRGPNVVRVQTGLSRRGRVLTHISEGIDPRAGEVWKIYGTRSSSGVVRTSTCAGSRRFGRIDTFVG
jgi:hypothetical protein